MADSATATASTVATATAWTSGVGILLRVVPVVGVLYYVRESIR